MQKIVISLLLATNLFAETPDVVKSPDTVLNRVNKTLSGFPPDVTTCSGCSEKREPNFESCVRKICGDPQKNNNYVSQYQALQKKVSTLNNSKWPLLETKFDEWAKFIDQEKNQELESTKRGVALIASGKVKIPAEFYGVVFTMAQVSFMDLLSIEPQVSDDGEVKLSLNLKESKFQLPSYIEAQSTFQIFEKIYSQIGKKSILGILELKERYPGKGFPEILKMELDASLVKINLIEKDMIISKFLTMTGENLGREKERLTSLQKRIAEKGKQLDDYDVEAILEYIIAIDGVDAMRGLFQTDQKRDQAFINQLFKNPKFVKDIQQIDLKNQDAKDELKAVKESCKQSYLEAESSLLGVSPDQAEQLIKNAMANIQKGVISRLSTHSASLLNNHLSNVYFAKPLFPKNFEESFSYYLNETASSEAPKDKNDQTSDVLNAIQKLGLGLVDISGRNGDVKKATRYEEIREFCESYSVRNIDDSSLGFKSGKIKISWNSIADTKAGISVLSHELGHMISKVIQTNPSMSLKSSESYSKARVCLTKNNVFNPADQMQEIALASAKDKVTHRDGLYTEEDWADLIAARSDFQNYNLSCFLIANLTDKQGKLSYDTGALKQKEGDPHSTDLFRLLNVEYQKRGVLPSECHLDYLNEIGVDFKSCL